MSDNDKKVDDESTSENEVPSTELTASSASEKSDSNTSNSEDESSESIAEKEEQVADAEDATETASAPSDALESKAKSASKPAKKTSRGFPWFTSFVFLLVLVLAAVIAYLAYQGREKLQSQSKILETLQQIQGAQAQQSAQNLALETKNQQQKQQQLQTQLKKAQTDIQDLTQRLNAQSKRLRAMSDTSRDDWLLAEAQYLLKLANQRIRIERSPEGADALLQEADSILRDLDDPNLHGLRRAIAKDLAALRLLKKIDVEGIYLNLVALTEQIESIPTRVVSQRNNPLSEDGKIVEEQEKSFWETVKGSWARFTQSFKDYVRVVHHEEKPKPLLPVQDQMYLQQNLRLMLERAQLALLREQQDIYEQSLTQADKWLATYYNESDVLNKFRNQLATLQQKNVVQELPDISGSLQQIHDYIADLHNLKGVAKPVSKASKKSSQQNGDTTPVNSEKK